MPVERLQSDLGALVRWAGMLWQVRGHTFSFPDVPSPPCGLRQRPAMGFVLTGSPLHLLPHIGNPLPFWPKNPFLHPLPAFHPPSNRQ